MNENTLNKLMEAIAQKEIDVLGWENFKFIPATNQEELRTPDAPTWNSEGSYYHVHVMYNKYRDAYTNKGGRVLMTASERYAYFVVTYTTEEGLHIEKVHTIEIRDNIIDISTSVRANNENLGSFNQEVDMDSSNWENRFAWYLTSGRR
ncbi:hypothetical protein [uncultured Mediterranean phage uvMED]|jgi:hypothetical protein|nr:hypothetical protein [uncultured Mediterranean phage uvMED]